MSCRILCTLVRRCFSLQRSRCLGHLSRPFYAHQETNSPLREPTSQLQGSTYSLYSKQKLIPDQTWVQINHIKSSNQNISFGHHRLTPCNFYFDSGNMIKIEYNYYTLLFCLSRYSHGQSLTYG